MIEGPYGELICQKINPNEYMAQIITKMSNNSIQMSFYFLGKLILRKFYLKKIKFCFKVSFVLIKDFLISSENLNSGKANKK